jgi:hypothetical protein
MHIASLSDFGKFRLLALVPWELGYFDGFSGRVFVYPFDKAAATNAKGREYLRVYPLIPLKGRAEYLRKNLPKSSTNVQTSGSSAVLRNDIEQSGTRLKEDARAPVFDYAQQEATVAHGRRLIGEGTEALADPLRALNIMNEVIQAYWRLWGLMPPPRRPGGDEGKWGR